MRNRRQRVTAGAAVAVAMAVTAACGGESGGTEERVRPAGDSSALSPGYGTGGGYGDGGSEAAADAEDRSGPARTLALRDDAELGEVVTDSAGWTLYRFDEDSAEPPAATCEGDCATAWPPVPADDAEAAAGMAADLLGSVGRADGTRQLTLGGWPVYRYAKDARPGDVGGHGVGGTWHALAADGGKAGGGDGKDADGAAPPAGAGPEGSGTAPGGAALTAVEDPELGRLVRDAEGRTLYRFDKDTAWPMKSNCTGACLETWRPAAPVDGEALEGVDPELVTVLERPDGTEQLSIDCWPVYWYTGDEEPGDTAGHGVGGTWHAVTPDGKKAKAAS